MRSRPLVLLSLGLALAACRGGDGGGDNGDGGDDALPPDGNTVTVAKTVFEVQNDATPEGTPVELTGVIVTAIDTYGARTGDLWVQDPTGGEFSGVKVFGAPLDQVASLAVGDIVNIVGAEKEEFALMTDTSGNTVTELKPLAGGTMTITKTGTGNVPAPASVDALAIDMLATPAERDAAWEKWEGVLITVTKARQLTEVTSFGDMDVDQQKFDITGRVEVQSLLTDLGANAVRGTCYAGITGIGDYFFSYKLLPRTTSDLVGGGTECAAEQMPTAATIADIQSGTTTGLVMLDDVYVVAVSFNKNNLWVASSLTAAPNEGIYVFRGNNSPDLDATIVPGAKVDVEGTVVEYNNDATGDTLTQITGPTVTFVEAPTAPPVPVAGKTVTELMAASTGEPYESVLVTLTNVKVAMVGMPTFFVANLAQYPGNVAFKADDLIYRFMTPDMDACYASITGIWNYSVFENAYIFEPLAPGTGTGVCN